MDWFAIVRRTVWQNTGFGALRSLRARLDEYEPRYEPLVVPLVSDSKDDEAASSNAEHNVEPPRKSIAASKYYSVEDYHRMYLSGELTPTAVVEALLPLIRRDISPPGEHSIAWFSINIDRVIKAAAESTQRYQENRSLGILDGVPTAAKDEYDLPGHKKYLGSAIDYTEGDDVVSWVIAKLEEAGAVVLGKLSMHEYGLGRLFAVTLLFAVAALFSG